MYETVNTDGIDRRDDSPECELCHTYVGVETLKNGAHLCLECRDTMREFAYSNGEL